MAVPTHQQGWRYLSSLTRTLAWNDFKLRYAGSALGYIWSVSKPLLLFGVLYLVFTQVLRFGGDVENYPVMLLLALVLWTFFVETTKASVTVLVGNADLLRKVAFPRIALPLAVSLTAALAMVFNLFAVFLFMTINGITPTLSWLYFPLLLLELYILATGIALWLSILYVQVRDVGQIWDLLIQMLFYSVPILYPLSMVPVDYRAIMLSNPLGQIVQHSREVHIGTSSGLISEALTGPLILIPFAICAAVFLSGLWLYKIKAPYLAERV